MSNKIKEDVAKNICVFTEELLNLIESEDIVNKYENEILFVEKIRQMIKKFNFQSIFYFNDYYTMTKNVQYEINNENYSFITKVNDIVLKIRENKKQMIKKKLYDYYVSNQMIYYKISGKIQCKSSFLEEYYLDAILNNTDNEKQKY